VDPTPPPYLREELAHRPGDIHLTKFQGFLLGSDGGRENMRAARTGGGGGDRRKGKEGAVK